MLMYRGPGSFSPSLEILDLILVFEVGEKGSESYIPRSNAWTNRAMVSGTERSVPYLNDHPSVKLFFPFVELTVPR